MSREAAFTIVDGAYFHFAVTLAESFVEHNPNRDFYIFLLEDNDKGEYHKSGITVKIVNHLIVEDIRERKKYYEITELSTSIKPNIFLWLFDNNYERVIYFDPDIFIYKSVDYIYDLLEERSIVVTPHSCSPVYDGKRPDDLNFMRAGVFNLGFIGVSRGEEGLRFANWWADRLKLNSFSAFSLGMFTDQKWIDLLPCYFDDYYISKHPGLNVAYWNLHERTIHREGTRVKSNGEDLIFFHFSGISLYGSDISKYQTRFDWHPNLDTELLFDQYRSKLHQSYAISAGYRVTGSKNISYIDRLIYFHYYAYNKDFSYDDRIVAFGDKIEKIPRLLRKPGGRAILKMMNNKIVKDTNNSINKINLSYLIYRAIK